jgi:hypothetical protein
MSSVVIHDEGGDLYLPGKGGNAAIRNRAKENLYRAHPSVRQRIEMNTASEIWAERRLLTFKEKITDGFTVRYSKELIVVDKRNDVKLLQFLAYCRGVLSTLCTQREKVAAVSSAVCSALGGSVEDEQPGAHAGEGLQPRMHRLIKEACKEKHEQLPLGVLCGGPIFDLPPGAGICRHRSLLFKYTCDMLDVCACAMVDGVMPKSDLLKQGCRASVRRFGNMDHMWNVVHMDDGERFLVDALNLPGTLCDSDELDEIAQKWKCGFTRRYGGAGLSLAAPKRGVIGGGDSYGKEVDPQYVGEDQPTTCGEVDPENVGRWTHDVWLADILMAREKRDGLTQQAVYTMFG